MIIPLFGVPPTQLCTADVASTSTNTPAVATDTALAIEAPATGLFVPLTPVSVHDPLATDTLTVPAVPILFTNNISVAFEIFAAVVPGGNTVKSNCTNPWYGPAPPTFTVGRLPKFVAFPEAKNESCKSGASWPHATAGAIMTAPRTKDNILCFKTTSLNELVSKVSLPALELN